MKRLLSMFSVFLATALLAAGAAPKPNVIFILCDDLGYGDIGVFYQNLRKANNDRSEPWHFTPKLDAVAAEGLQLPHHYCPAPVCAPSRASLLLGVHQGHANIRDNQFDKALESNHTLGTVLKGAGYATACIGKWGLQGSGSTPTAWAAYPTKRGFDYYYGYVRHGDGHEHYPKEGTYQGAKEVWDMNTEVSASLDKCYTADLWTARAKKWIVDQHAASSSQPFFLYLAYDTPHATCELPTMAYPAGGGLTGGLQWQGTPGAMINTAGGTVDGYMHPDYTGQTYDSDKNASTAEVAWPNVMKRYATTVRRLDDCVGDLIQTLKDLGIDNNTLIVFTTDNGVSDESYLSTAMQPYFFNSFGPFDGIKRDCWEGGARVGALVRWPAGIPGNRVSNLPSQFQDWMPTFAELAGVPVPARVDGVSLVPTLENISGQKTPQVYTEYYFAGSTPSYSEFDVAKRGRARNQMQLIRSGNYVGVRYNIQSHADNFEIYDIVNDPKESVNLASTLTALQQQMKDKVLRMRRSDSGAARPYDSEQVPPLTPLQTTSGVEWKAYTGSFPWLPELTNLTPVSGGTVGIPSLAIRPQDNDVALLFTGYLNVPGDGSYTFYLNADTRAFLRIHEAAVIDADFGYAGGTEKSAVMNLKAGKHPFRLYYARGSTGTPALSLQWSGPGVTRQAIAASAFSRDGIGVNTPPQTVDDTVLIQQDAATTLAVLANDSDDGQPQALSIASVTTPRSGTAVISGTQIVYTPTTGFLGEDFFTYTATDGTSSAIATVRVTVAYADGDYWFPFNQTSGLTTREAGGYRAATLTGFTVDPAQWVAGHSDKGLQFDGVDDCVGVDNFNGITGTNARTCSAWVKTTGTGQMPVIAWGPNSTGNKWTFLIQSGQPRIEVTGGFLQAGHAVNDGQWHHIACTFTNDGTPNVTDTKLYIDGVLETTFAASGSATVNTSGSAVKIGGDIQSRFFTGTLDDARIHGRALSATEIAAQAAETNNGAAIWQRRYFGIASFDWNADDDRDGRNRLFEYAFGTQPRIRDSTPVASTSRDDGYLRITYPRRRAGSHSLSYVVQASADLIDWTTLTTVEVSSVPAGDFDQVTSRTTIPALTERLFMRVRVTGP
ncbi:sulfatase-like hydrolase/transferase [Luteolibacter ambystomatis]|uniref:Sulfatase-like hydrolase/transferase n=1 Tax=Luteolibacter ambystomatis TaxID=2824561 RepID=A0A975G866_9BACT|nr:sulfatase-like hydrolase/transferase [Luteolibacter ambystomatis]QUE51117.1 sulfatase-like hydrolase/transferase [Luteolibacter ambystomatis]